MITPFTPAGEVDYETAWELARHLVANGNDAIVVCGTTGESPTLSDLEKVGLFRTVVEAVGDKVPVVAGTGTYDTAHSIAMTRKAAEVGCHGVLAVTPYYSRPPQAGLLAHFTAIADSTELPILLYNIPGRTARLIEIPTLKQLAELDNIVGVKDAVDDVEWSKEQMVAMPEDFAIYAGSDSFTYDLVSMGGSGVVGVASHLVGKQMGEMIAALRNNDRARADQLNEVLMPLFDALFLEPNPMPIKAALTEVWKDVGNPRLPLVPCGEGVLAKTLDALGAVQRA